MTAYDPELIDRLVREAREDDVTIPRCWEVEHDRNDQPNIYAVDLHAGDRYWVAILPHQCVKSIEDEQNATAVALVRVRDNLAAMADQLEAAHSELRRIATVRDRALEGCTPPPSAVSLSEFVEWLDNFERHASERSKLRDQLEAARREIERLNADSKVAWEQADILADGLEQACSALVADRGADTLRAKLRKLYRDAYRAAKGKT